MKDKNVAAFLAIVFGILGFQKWYLGSWFELALCVGCTAFISSVVGISVWMSNGEFYSLVLLCVPWLMGIADGISLLNKDYNTFNDRYNRRYKNEYKPM